MLDWFPDWRGQSCVIVASGPSAAKVDLSLCKHFKFIAINNSWQLAPWADVLYAADGKWWDRYHDTLWGFQGMKVTVDKAASIKYGLNLVELARGRYNLVTDDLGKIGVGGNSGFHAINLAIQFGIDQQLILVGFDMTAKNGTHWHGDHVKGLSNPRDFNMERWGRIIDEAYPRICELGIRAVNVSDASKLNAYPKMTMEEVMGRQ